MCGGSAALPPISARSSLRHASHLRRSARFPGGKRSGWRLGGYPQPPTKEGCALSGLSRRMGNPVRAGGLVSKPSPKRAAPSLDSPAGWETRPGRWSGTRTPAKEGCAVSGLFRRMGNPVRAGGPVPQPPPKRAAPSLDSPTGRELSLRSDCDVQHITNCAIAPKNQLT